MAASAALVLLSLAGLGLPARASAAPVDPGESVGIQLLEAPVDRRWEPRALRYIVDHLAPGMVIRRQVLVVNKSSDRQRIEVYPAAATVDKGQFQFGEGRATNELTSWISLDRTRVDLEAGDEARVEVTITVPPAASVGEQYGVIWASVDSKPKPSSNVKQIHRVGVRIYLDIGPGGEPPSEFTIGDLVPGRDEHGEPWVNINVTNTGGRALDMTGSVTLTDGPAGTHAGPFDVVRGTTLAPKESGTVAVRFPRELPNGSWKIEVNLEGGMVKHHASAQITFPEPGQEGESTFPFARLGSPWTLAGGSLAVGVGVVAGLAFVARRTRRGLLRG